MHSAVSSARADTASVVGASPLAKLCRPIKPIPPDLAVGAVADLIQQSQYAALLCLPVVDRGVPVGTISRHRLTQIFLHRFGRELYGSRPVSAVMNTSPLLVDLELPLEAAAQKIAGSIDSPISEDFVLTQAGTYIGVGSVIDLLEAIQQNLVDAFRQLKSSQAALVQSEKMASLGVMVAGVAHEINTPLGYVRNNIELVRETFDQMRLVVDQSHQAMRMIASGEGADEEAMAEHLSQLHEQLESLHDSQLVEDTAALFGDTMYGLDSIRDLVVTLRNFTRMDQGVKTEVDVNACLDQALVIANNVLKGRIEVVKRYGRIPAILGAPAQINQVLLNLITNAAHAIEHERGRLLLITEANEHAVTISVQDNGKGVEAAELKKIFDPFYTTKPVGQGTGLGLSICRQIIKGHGGNIRVVSIPGRGTRFIVHLPLPVDAWPKPERSVLDAAG